MNVTTFPEVNITFGQDQPEYLPLPAHRKFDNEGTIICCWSLSWGERLRLLVTGRIWHSVLTFGQALQPQLLSIEKPAVREDVVPEVVERVVESQPDLRAVVRAARGGDASVKPQGYG